MIQIIRILHPLTSYSAYRCYLFGNQLRNLDGVKTYKRKCATGYAVCLGLNFKLCGLKGEVICLLRGGYFKVDDCRVIENIRYYLQVISNGNFINFEIVSKLYLMKLFFGNAAFRKFEENVLNVMILEKDLLFI